MPRLKATNRVFAGCSVNPSPLITSPIRRSASLACDFVAHIATSHRYSGRQRLSGRATRRIIEREWQVFGNQEYARLAEISVAHLYNLGRSVGYRQRADEFIQARPSPVAIGERRKPNPQDRPGYLRVDMVHQGDWEGQKGVYLINSVDAVPQWEILGCVPRISEQHLLPVREAMLHQFPFRILSFHTGNGAEFVNRSVARLLNKRLVEFTRSRPNRSSDNALVEGMNGAISRKHLACGPIAGGHAERSRRRYRQQNYATPYEKLRGLPEAHRYLNRGPAMGTVGWLRLHPQRYRGAAHDARQGRGVARMQTRIAIPAEVPR